MAHCALWVRTTRHINTHENDIAEFALAAGRALGRSAIGGALLGDDVVVVAIRFEGGPDLLLRHLDPVLRAAGFEDWCAVEIGQDFASSIMNVSEDAETPFGASLLVWGRPFAPMNTYGAKALFVDLQRQRREDDRLLGTIERKLRQPVSRLWHGRSSIVLVFHDMRAPDEIARPLKPLLDDVNHVAEWCLFEIGSRSASRANLNGMSDFIERNYRQAKGMPATPRPFRPPAHVLRDRARQPRRSAFPILRERSR